jgi:HEAT repeat protein
MRRAALALVTVLLCTSGVARTQQQTPPPAPQAPATAISAADLQTAIDRLGSFDFPVRMEASRTVRRAPADLAVPMLSKAARSHTDEYVRYRALTLLAGFGDASVTAVMRDLKADRNDRLRTVAFAWYEHATDPALLPSLIEALQKERSEFVRPALIRAIAAHGTDPRARAALTPLVARGDDYFRGAVIESLGDFDGKYALAEITEVAKFEGPLQDDAITALGKIGDASSATFLATLQKTAPREVQPTIFAALCLLGSGCPAAEEYLRKTLTFAATTDGYAALLRGAVHATGMLATRGQAPAMATLFDLGNTAREGAREPIALGVGMIALRRPAVILTAIEGRKDRAESIELLRDAFDMLNEDFEEERFYVEVRRAYWAAAAGSPRRQVAEAIIQKLEF